MATRKINMLQMVNGFAVGGGEIKLLELIKNLNPEKYNITICSVGQGGPLQSEFESLGHPVYVFEKKFSFDFSLVTRVSKLMKEKQIDLVQTTLFYADVIGAYAAWLANVPIVISWEAVSHPYKMRHLLSYKLAKRKMDVVVGVSDAIRNQVIEERGVEQEKAVTIHYGIDLQKYYLSNKLKRADISVAKNDLVLGTVARYTDQKGHKYLISAAPDIIKTFPNVHFVFVGDGPNRSDMEAQIKQLGLQNHFHLLGFRTDVVDLLNLFDVFVLPSLYEGLPNVVLEAMACHKPVIATGVDGTVEAVEDGITGYIVPPKNPAALAEKINHLLSLNGKIETMGKASRNRVENHFSLEKQIQEFENLYERLIEKKM